MDISNWINLAAVVVSVGSAITAAIFTSKSNKIQKRMLQIEESRIDKDQQAAVRAQLRCYTEPSKKGSRRLVVTNSGEGTAQDISLFVNGQPLNQHRAFASITARDFTPLSRPLRANESMKFTYLTGLWNIKITTAQLTWTNEDGSSGTYETGL